MTDPVSNSLLVHLAIDENGVHLARIEEARCKPFPSALLHELGERSGHWYELRDRNDKTIYRRAIAVHGMARGERGAPFEGDLELLIPNLEAARDLVLFGSVRSGRDGVGLGPARERFRVSLADALSRPSPLRGWADCGTDGTVLGCTQIVDSGGLEDRLNLVILGDGFTANEMEEFAAKVNHVVDKLLTNSPISIYRNAINIFRIDVASTDSGVTTPTIDKRTYFETRWQPDKVERLTWDDVCLRQVCDDKLGLPRAWHAAMLLANLDVDYSKGPGISDLSYHTGACATGKLFEMVFVHELGHALFELSDEYTGSGECPSAEPIYQNTTLASSRAGLEAVNKWADLLTPGVPLPTSDKDAGKGTVGLFEGAGDCESGLYRGMDTCLMKSTRYDYFCAVCSRQIIHFLETFAPAYVPIPYLALYSPSSGSWEPARHPATEAGNLFTVYDRDYPDFQSYVDELTSGSVAPEWVSLFKDKNIALDPHARVRQVFYYPHESRGRWYISDIVNTRSFIITLRRFMGYAEMDVEEAILPVFPVGARIEAATLNQGQELFLLAINNDKLVYNVTDQTGQLAHNFHEIGQEAAALSVVTDTALATLDSQILVLAISNQTLYWTLYYGASDTWGGPFTLVPGLAGYSGISRVSCAQVSGQWGVCILASSADAVEKLLFNTLTIDGNWGAPWTDVGSGLSGPFMDLACLGPGDQMLLCVLNGGGLYWASYYGVSGTWSGGLAPVPAQVAAGSIEQITGASVGGSAYLCLYQNHNAWWTSYEFSSGEWPYPFTAVGVEGLPIDAGDLASLAGTAAGGQFLLVATESAKP